MCGNQKYKGKLSDGIASVDVCNPNAANTCISRPFRHCQKFDEQQCQNSICPQTAFCIFQRLKAKCKCNTQLTRCTFSDKCCLYILHDCILKKHNYIPYLYSTLSQEAPKQALAQQRNKRQYPNLQLSQNLNANTLIYYRTQNKRNIILIYFTLHFQWYQKYHQRPASANPYLQI